MQSPVTLRVTPISLAEANAFIEKHHRHHQAVLGHIFCVAVAEGDEVRGVATVGRPVARALQDGFTAEVNRVCTDGTKNACSMLYATCWRAAKALGYRRLLTYTMQTEPGTSLRAAGWKLVGESPGRSWDVPGRPRVTRQETLGGKFRWEAA